MSDRDLSMDDITADSTDLGSEPEVDALVVEIAATRSEMAQTVDELGDRLDPGLVVDRAGDAVREATIGKLETKVNDVTTAASDLAANAGQTAQEAGSGIVETIRRNPVPALMAGVGLGLLWMNRADGMSRARTNGYYAGSRSWDTGNGGWQGSDRSAFDQVGTSISNRARGATEGIGEAAESAKLSASRTADELTTTASRTVDDLGATTRQAVTQAQHAVESNPLAFGAIAMAVGAAIGLALPATEAEKRVVGSTGSRMIDQVESAVSEPLDRMATSASS